MVEDMVEADGGALARAEGPAGELPAAGAAEPEPDELSWDEQVRCERRIMADAAQLIRDVRHSEVHRKLPHFYVVDRQLQLIENQLEDISVRVKSFWRYGRDAPMRDLLTLPVLQMVAGTGSEALVPLLGPPASERDCPAGPAEDEEVEAAEGHEADSALLGVDLDAERDVIESAYRRRSRHYHRHGRCCNIRGFHALTAARNRCLARVSAPLLPAYGTGGDILARYLLAGTDPGKSRYREYAHGILDSWHRGRMLYHLQVVQWPTWDIPLTWGDEDILVMYGGPNHMGASG